MAEDYDPFSAAEDAYDPFAAADDSEAPDAPVAAQAAPMGGGADDGQAGDRLNIFPATGEANTSRCMHYMRRELHTCSPCAFCLHPRTHTAGSACTLTGTVWAT